MDVIECERRSASAAFGKVNTVFSRGASVSTSSEYAINSSVATLIADLVAAVDSRAMSWSARFLNNPKQFADQYALVPLLGTSPHSDLKPKTTVSPPLTFYQVKGDNRVLYAKVRRNQTAQNRCDVDFANVAADASWFATYWLPFHHNATYRITLKPGSGPGLGADFFFTAALSGCMVSIDGSRQTPTVYHSNAEDTNSGKSGADAKTHDILAKLQAMQSTAIPAMTDHPKGPRTEVPRTVNIFHYAPLSITDQLYDADVLQHRLRLQAQTLIATHMGTVFGVRDTTSGEWTFYYQSLTKLYYMKNYQMFEQWLVNRCDDFWPS